MSLNDSRESTDGEHGMRARTAAPPRHAQRRRLVAAALGVTLALARGRVLGDAPASTVAMTLLRALAYDVNLKDRAGSSVVLAVLHRPTSSPSRRESQDLMKAFKELEAVTVQGLPFRVTSLPFTDADALEQGARAAEISILYVCASLEDDLPAIRELARKLKIRTSGGKEALAVAGLSLAVDPEAKPSLIVNLKQSRDEGASFSSALLRLAKVIK